MGVQVIRGTGGNVLYCDVSMTAFGPVFDEEENPDEFLEWLEKRYQLQGVTIDARQLPTTRLVELVNEWRAKPAAKTVKAGRLPTGVTPDGEIV